MAITVEADLIINTNPDHGESPWWDSTTNTLLWVDILGRAIHRYDPINGVDSAIRTPEHVGSVVASVDGSLVAILQSGYALVRPDGSLDWLAQVESDYPDTRFNDGKCDPDGRFLGGTMSYTGQPNSGSLYRLNQDKNVDVLLSGLTIANGMAWSGDGQTLFFIDSADQGVRSYAYSSDGELRHLGMAVEISEQPGAPDGMTIDSEGCLWVAMFSGGVVSRYTPDGRLDRNVRLPASGVTSCALGGPHLDQMFITTSPYGLSDAELAAQPHAGGVFTCEVPAPGLPEPRFGA